MVSKPLYARAVRSRWTLGLDRFGCERYIYCHLPHISRTYTRISNIPFRHCRPFLLKEEIPFTSKHAILHPHYKRNRLLRSMVIQHFHFSPSSLLSNLCSAVAQDFQSTCTYTTTECAPFNPGPTETITVYEVPFTATATSTFDCQGCNYVSVSSRNCDGVGLVSRLFSVFEGW